MKTSDYDGKCNENTKKQPFSCLVVEDNPLYRTKITELLSNFQYACHSAENGEVAVTMANRFKYNFILMDIHMPIMNGIEATRAIREFDKDVVILGITARSTPENTEICLQAGFDDVLIKPLDKDLLCLSLSAYQSKGDYQL